MPKKNNDPLSLLTLLPWWASLPLAPLAYVFLSQLVPAILGDNPFAPLLAPVLSFLGIAIAAIFILAAAVSYFAALRKRRLLDRQTSLDSIRALSWREFEELVAEAYRRDGYRVLENEGAGPDGGVDIRLRTDGALHLVQCKNWRSRRVGVRVAREVYGVLAAERAQQAVIVCSGDFTEDARRFAGGKPIRLVAGEDLLALVQGVRPAQDRAVRSSDPNRSKPVRLSAGLPQVRRAARRAHGEARGPRRRPVPRMRDLSALPPHRGSAQRLTLRPARDESRRPPSRRSRRPSRQPLRGAWRRP